MRQTPPASREKCASASPPSIARRWRSAAADRRRHHRARARSAPTLADVPRPDAVQSASTSSNRAPGQKLTVMATRRPSICARSQCRDAFRATGPLMPKCVQSIAPRRRLVDRAVDPDRQFDVLRHAGQRAMNRRRSTAAARAPASARHDRVAEPPGDVEAGAVAAGLRQRLAARGEDHGRALTGRRWSRDDRNRVRGCRACDVEDAMAGTERRADARRFPAAARRARRAIDWCRETACRRPLRGG